MGDWRVTAYVYGYFCSWEDEKVLKLDGVYGCPTLNIIKPWIVHCKKGQKMKINEKLWTLILPI